MNFCLDNGFPVLRSFTPIICVGTSIILFSILTARIPSNIYRGAAGVQNSDEDFEFSSHSSVRHPHTLRQHQLVKTAFLPSHYDLF